MINDDYDTIMISLKHFQCGRTSFLHPFFSCKSVFSFVVVVFFGVRGGGGEEKFKRRNLDLSLLNIVPRAHSVIHD